MGCFVQRNDRKLGYRLHLRVALRFSSNGKEGTDGVRNYRLESGLALEIPSGRLLARRIDLHAQFTDPNSAKDFFQDGDRVAISSPSQGNIRIFDLSHEVRLLKQFAVPTGDHNLAVSPDGKIIAFWQFEPRTDVTFYSTEDGHVVSKQRNDPGVEEFGYTADSQGFIEITDDGFVMVDVNTGQIRWRPWKRTILPGFHNFAGWKRDRLVRYRLARSARCPNRNLTASGRQSASSRARYLFQMMASGC